MREREKRRRGVLFRGHGGETAGEGTWQTWESHQRNSSTVAPSPVHERVQVPQWVPSFNRLFNRPSLFLYIYIYISRFFPCLYEKGLKSTRERSHTATKLRGRLPLREAVPLRLISRCIYVYNLSPDDVFLCEDFFTSYYFLTLGSLWFRKSLKREVEYTFFSFLWSRKEICKRFDRGIRFRMDEYEEIYIFWNFLGHDSTERKDHLS